MEKTYRGFDIEEKAAANLTALDLRENAARATRLHPDRGPRPSRDEIAEELDAISTQEPFVQHPVMCFRIAIVGMLTTAEAVVLTNEGRLGIACGGYASWGDIGAVDLTTVVGGDAFATTVRLAVDEWLNDREAWELRA